MNLSVELLPATDWRANVRSQVSQQDWDRMRREVYRAAKYRCECCGAQDSRPPVECHEEWEYDMPPEDADRPVGTQRLVRLAALCPSCHDVKHLGRAAAEGRDDAALEHLQDVNGWTEEQAHREQRRAAAATYARLGIPWDLDLRVLHAYGLDLGIIPAEERRDDSGRDWGLPVDDDHVVVNVPQLLAEMVAESYPSATRLVCLGSTDNADGTGPSLRPESVLQGSRPLAQGAAFATLSEQVQPLLDTLVRFRPKDFRGLVQIAIPSGQLGWG